MLSFSLRPHQVANFGESSLREALIAVECTVLKQCMTVVHVAASNPDTLTAFGTVCNAVDTFPEQK